jgi:asparagine N-glycosylation enzyme membrane subunit Stt3
MTYLELINDVLIRLRETTVSTNAETTYSTLIGKFVNDAKRQVEDSFSWNVLSQTITVTTVASTPSYSLTGAGQKFQIQDAINVTSNVGMINISFVDMNRKQNFLPLVNAIPTEFAFDGVDGSGDTKVNLFPIPDNVYSIKFALTVPQATLSADGTSVLVPDVLVAQNAYARALVERGEDGGLSSSEAYLLYKSMLSDHIALEGTRYPETGEFVAI